jgi:hypothetical protein
LVQRKRRRRDTEVYLLPDLRDIAKSGSSLPVKDSKKGSPLPQERKFSDVKNGSRLPTEGETRRTDKEEVDSLSADADRGQTPNLISLEKRFIQKWNNTSGVAMNRGDALTKKRRDAFRARMRDKEWVASVEEALAKFPLKLFSEDPGGWKPNVDWFLRPDTVNSILEGRYDWTKSGARRPSATSGPCESDQ